jgi:hypothetical protein
MKKRLRFLYRYVIVSRRWKKWLSSQTVIVIVASLAFLSTLAWTAPRASGSQPGLPWRAGAEATLQAMTTTPSPAGLTDGEAGAAAVESGDTNATPTPTPLPPEYLTNADQTIGITMAGAVLVLIVLFGAATAMPRHES